MIPGPKVILLGDSGTGKTYSCRTFIDAGIEPFFLFTEPGMEVISDLAEAGKAHYAHIGVGSSSWEGLRNVASMVNKLSYEGVAKMTDANKSKYTGFLDVIETCNNFVDQNGESFGDIMTWGTDRVFILDSLSGLNELASQLVVGGKPVKGMQDWQVGQNMIKTLLNQLTSSLKCHFVLISHIAREKDEITGGMHLTVSTLGKALAPEIPRYFSDVVQTVRMGDQFYWDTAGTNIICKARNLPIKSKLDPSFTQLIDAWKARGGKIIETAKAAA